MAAHIRRGKNRKKQKKEKTTQVKKNTRWEMIIEKLEERITPGGPAFCVNDLT